MRKSVAGLLISLALSGLLLAQRPARLAPKTTSKTAKPLTTKAKEGPFRVNVKLKGMVFPTTQHERVLRPKAWSDFVVDKTVDHGTQVTPDQKLVEFDREKINGQIADLTTQIKQDALALDAARDGLDHTAKSNALALATAERAFKLATEDLDRLRKVFRPSDERRAKHKIKDLQNTLAYEQEELKQLEKMYTEDEATEETEEIILRRQRDWVNKIKFILKESNIQTENTLKVVLPRMEKAQEVLLAKAKLGLDKLKLDLPRQLKAKKISLQQLELKTDNARARLLKLRQDAEMMVVKAPAAGVVYYGNFAKGKWLTSEADRSLVRGSRVRGHQVFMTIVSLKTNRVVVSIPEANLKLLKPGQKARVTANRDNSLVLWGRIISISRIPTSPGNFTAKIDCELKTEDSRFVPGIGCKVEITPYNQKKAVTVTKSCVFIDEADSDKNYVWRWDARAKKATKSYVKVGQSSATQTEITQGLKAGDEVLRKAPKNDK